MARRVYIDFYTVALPDDPGVVFSDILDSALAMPDDESRSVTVRDKPLRLQSVLDWNGSRIGELLRIDFEVLPLRADIEGHTSPIELEDDEGVGANAVFLYNPTLNILLLQRARNTVSASAFAAYFSRMYNLDGPLILEPVLSRNTMRQLGTMSSMRSLEFRIAPLNRTAIFEDLGLGIPGLLRLGQAMESPKVEIKCSMSHVRGSLVQNTVRELVRTFQGVSAIDQSAVDKLIISGKDEEDELSIIDILEDRMDHYGDIEPDAQRQLPYLDRVNLLKSAWQARRDEMQQMFGQL